MILVGLLSSILFAGEEKAKESTRQKLLEDKSLLFFVPFDFSVDANVAYHHKEGNLGGEGEYIPGVVENCLSLPAKGDGTVSYNLVDNIDFNKASTLMFWFKPYWWGDDTETRTLLWIKTSDSRYYAIHKSFNPKDLTALYMMYAPGGHQTNTTTWKKDKWVHLAVTWDAATDKYIGYSNGVVQFSSDMYWIHAEKLPIEVYDCSLGAYYSGTKIDGCYDEFYILGRALSAEEISNYYQETRPKE
jgi:hypothetical protein